MANLSHNFERSISLNDLDSSVRVRELVQEDIVSPQDERRHCHLRSSSELTFVLSSFQDLALDFKKFLYSYLLDVGIYKELEQTKKLNWCPSLFPMVPVLTIGDGNCLMHAASIGMWAVNDRYHTLRKLVYNAIVEDTEGLFHKRWQREHELTNLRTHGYSMSEEQWNKEWETVLQLVSPEEYPQGEHGMKYGSLEEIHIFVLANVLRRTIIVVSSDTLRGNYDESLSPVNFPGIYMPLNWDPVDCVKTPLVIGFAQGHFTAIVSFEDGVFDQGEAIDDVGLISDRIHGVPLQKHDGTPLPIHFLFANEDELTDGLLRQYLDCKKLTYKDPEDGTLAVTLAAKVNFVPPPEPIKTLVDGFFTRARETYLHMVQTKELQAAGEETPALELKPCRTEGCEFFGTQETLFLCSKCLEKHLRNEENQAALFAHNMGFPGAETALKEEHAPWRMPLINTGIKKEVLPSPGGANVREGNHQVSFVQQQQTMEQGRPQQQQTAGFIQQQQQREFELIEQQQQRQQLQQEFELAEKQRQQREREHQLEVQQHQQERQRQLEQQERERQLAEQQQQRERERERERQLAEQQQQRKREHQLEVQQQQQERQRQLEQQERQRERERQLAEQQQQREREHQLEVQQQQQERQRQLAEQQRQQQQAFERLQEQQHQQRERQFAEQERQQQQQQPKKCMTHGCKYQTSAESGNLCFRCYEAETLAEQQTASMVSMNIRSKPCAINGCQYFGIPQQDDFCSRCYRTFRLRIESAAGEKSVEVPSRSEDVTLPPVPNACQTAGCPNTGCPELYGRCVHCYSKCIKDFITSYEGLPLGSGPQVPPPLQLLPPPQPSVSPRPLTSSQPSPQIPPLPQPSPLPQAPLHSQPWSAKSTLCIFSGCQNKGVPSHGGQCNECNKIRPLNTEPVPTIAIMTKETNMSNTTTNAPTVAAGLPCGVPAIKEESQRLFCETPKCNNPVTEYSSCTQCIMARYRQETPPQLQPPPSLPSSGEPGNKTTEAKLYRENLKVGLGAVGFGLEKVGQNQVQGAGAAEERRQAVARARQNLPPLQMPPSSATSGLNPAQPVKPASVSSPGSNIQCLAPNCKFFGNAEHSYYCSRCFEKIREEWRKISELAKERRSRYYDPLVQEPLTRDPRMVTPSPKKIRTCALTYCYNLANPGNNGLCDKCYRTGLTTEREWQMENMARLESKRQPGGRLTASAPPPPPPPPPPAAASTSAPAPTRSARPLKKVFVDTGAPCKTQGCLKFGTSAQQGLCDPCYEKLQKRQPLATSASGSSSTSPVFVCMAQQRTSQPTNWSTPRKGPFNLPSGVTTTFSAQGPITVAQQNTTHLGSNRCKEEGCKMTGAPEFGGYCSQCFVEYTRQSSYPESIPDSNYIPKVQVPMTSTVSSTTNMNPTITTSTTTISSGLTTLATADMCDGRM